MPRPTLAHLVDLGLAVVDPAGLAVLVFGERRLVVRVVAVVAVVAARISTATARAMTDVVSRGHPSTSTDGCAGRILTTGKRRAFTASAACQGTRRCSARHTGSALGARRTV